MKIILSTTNPSKAQQIKAMFDHPDIEVLTLQKPALRAKLSRTA
ncbi:MAG: hypothetical protein JWL92_502 [Candidatus Nomurabacteria bacterium]|nr:hypothetical protein [Candidatus Nomurabacteria bacterium]